MAEYRLVYMSRARRNLSDADAEALADQAAQLNARSGVTGLLLFDGRRFIQALEGPEPSVTDTMDRIRRDVRHDMIEVMFEGTIPTRTFGDCSMKYKRAGENCCTSDFLARVRNRLVEVEEPELKAAFLGFAKLAYDNTSGNRM